MEEFPKAFLHLSLPGLLALSLRQEPPDRWKRFAAVRIRNPAAQGSKPSLSVCLPLLPASQVCIGLGESKVEIIGRGKLAGFSELLNVRAMTKRDDVSVNVLDGQRRHPQVKFFRRKSLKWCMQSADDHHGSMRNQGQEI